LPSAEKHKLRRHRAQHDIHREFDERRAARDGRVRAGPAARRVAGGERKARPPSDIRLRRKDGKRHDREDERDEDLVHVGAYKIEAHDAVKDRHEQKTDADLDKAAPKSRADHERVTERKIARLVRRVFVAGNFRMLRTSLAGRHDDHDGDHDERDGALEPFALQLDADERAEEGADRSCERERRAQTKVRIALAEEGADGRHVLRDDGDAVRAVGDGSRESQEHHDRHGEERPAAGEHVHPARGEAGEGQQREFPDFKRHMRAINLRSQRPSVTRRSVRRA
jgi:hypothetical protein